jgi:diguanylate cyclase (GGDEF)-like protein
MRIFDPQISRALESLSQFLNKKLEVTEGNGDTERVIISRAGPGQPPLAIRTAEGSGFSEGERDFLSSIVEVLHRDQLSRGELQNLDQRLRLLERENAELMLKNRALAEASARDALTGLYNRRYIVDKIDAEMNRALRHGNPMAIMMLDVDRFKTINDSFGHPVGDQVLQSLANFLKENCRIYDTPGRYGGEEFCLMLPDTRLENTVLVAERIRQRIESTPFVSGPITIHLTTSIGVAALESVPEEALFSAAALLERADRALYVAKDRGRNRVEMWSPSSKSHPLDH